MTILADTRFDLNVINTGYIAGTNDGIVTVMGKPSARKIWLLDANSMAVLNTGISLDNGHYILMGLDPNKEYVVMARDQKKEFEPFAWDYVKPAIDLTLAQQQALWASWQTN